MSQTPDVIGQLISGGVVHRMTAILNIDSEDIGLGSYVMIDGHRRRYYALVYDVAYKPPADPRFIEKPVRFRLPADLAEQVNKRVLRPIAELALTLCVEKNGASNPQVQPALYLPPLHSPICFAQDKDIALLFGEQDAPGHWVVGYTREQNLPIPLGLRKLLMRSSGIFGATGTGKSVLTRLLLCGVIKKRLGASLIFDMHNEFAYDDAPSESASTLPGLKSIFGDQVVTFGLGKATTIRGNKPDYTLEISLTDISPADIHLLIKELNLTDATSTVTSALVKSFGQNWLREFLRMTRDDEPPGEDSSGKSASVPTWAKKAGVNLASAQALWSKLQRVRRRPFISDNPGQDHFSRLSTMLKQGKHVILSFGEYDTDLDYLLVANLITRRVTEAWEQDAQQVRNHKGQEPKRLVVIVEEAHKLLSREMASQTVFGTLARELRKSNVVLWLIDQRPSEISDEIMSQIGTRISGWLGDDKDLEAVLVGLQAKEGIRRMLSSLQPNGQVIIAGWAVPMPIPIRVRRLDENFVRDIR